MEARKKDLTLLESERKKKHTVYVIMASDIKFEGMAIELAKIILIQDGASVTFF